MTEQDVKIQDLRAENEKLKEELEQLKQPKAEVDADMDKLTTEIKEYICDNLCKYPCTCRSEEHLMEVCEECQVEELLERMVQNG